MAVWDNCLQSVKDANGTEVGQIATLSCIPLVFQNLINWALGLAGVTALVFIMLAGYKWITSNGDPKQAEGAKQTLTFAIIGLVLILVSFFIINMISYFTKVDCIRQFGFTNCKT